MQATDIAPTATAATKILVLFIIDSPDLIVFMMHRNRAMIGQLYTKA
jgi:hypothetical protein